MNAVRTGLKNKKQMDKIAGCVRGKIDKIALCGTYGVHERDDLDEGQRSN